MKDGYIYKKSHPKGWLFFFFSKKDYFLKTPTFQAIAKAKAIVTVLCTFVPNNHFGELMSKIPSIVLKFNLLIKDKYTQIKLYPK